MAIKVAVIGCGYWGPNLVRNLYQTAGCELLAVADSDPDRLKKIKRQYPSLHVTPSAGDLMEGAYIDALVIATPISTHFELALQGLEQGKHVLIEKPMTETPEQAAELVQLAEKKNRVLMVDHTFLYTGAVRKIHELIDSGEIGEVYYYDSVRVNLGLFQHDVNVLWDLAPHDLSLMLHLLGKIPLRVSATGSTPVRWKKWELESVAYVTVDLTDHVLAHFHVNWLSPVKVRRTIIGGSKKMIIYDPLDPDNEVKVYDKGVEVRGEDDRYKTLVQYRTGDIVMPKLDQTEALKSVCEEFIDSIRIGRKPLTDGDSGLEVVRLLQAAQLSMETGRPIEYGTDRERAIA